MGKEDGTIFPLLPFVFRWLYASEFSAVPDVMPASSIPFSSLYDKQSINLNTLGVYLGTPSITRQIFVSEHNGNDTDGDGSRAKPFKTISRAYTHISTTPAIWTTLASDNMIEIYLLDGTFNEVLPINLTGIMISGQPGSGVSIPGTIEINDINVQIFAIRNVKLGRINAINPIGAGTAFLADGLFMDNVEFTGANAAYCEGVTRAFRLNCRSGADPTALGNTEEYVSCDYVMTLGGWANDFRIDHVGGPSNYGTFGIGTLFTTRPTRSNNAFFAVDTRASHYVERGPIGVEDYEWESGVTFVTAGAATATVANRLVDGGTDFVAAGVTVGMFAYNATTNNWARITNVIDGQNLELDADIFNIGDNYEITTIGATGALYDLDLSTIIPPWASAVHLKLTGRSTAAQEQFFVQSDNTPGSASVHGINTVVANQRHQAEVMVAISDPTSAIIHFYADTTFDALTLHVVGWE